MSMRKLPEILPTDHCFDDELGIFGTEVIDLRDACGWATERSVPLWDEVIERSLATVGVRYKDDDLVGIGFLAGNLRHAVLCDFVVHPDHRGMGIGTAIINRRLNLASQVGIPYLYTELSPDNVLRTYYEKLGFVATGSTYFRDTRHQSTE